MGPQGIEQRLHLEVDRETGVRVARLFEHLHRLVQLAQARQHVSEICAGGVTLGMTLAQLVEDRSRSFDMSSTSERISEHAQHDAAPSGTIDVLLELRKRLVEATQFHHGHGQIEMRLVERIVQLERPPAVVDRLLIPPREMQDAAVCGASNERERVQLARAADFGNGVVMAAESRQQKRVGARGRGRG